VSRLMAGAGEAGRRRPRRADYRRSRPACASGPMTGSCAKSRPRIVHSRYLAAPRRGARKDAVALGLRRGAPLRPLTGCGPFLSGAVYSHWSCQARWMALPPIAMCPPLIRIGDSQHLLLCTRFGQLFRGGSRFFRSFQPMIELVEGDVGHLVCSLHSGGSATIVSQPLGPVSYAQRSG